MRHSTINDNLLYETHHYIFRIVYAKQHFKRCIVRKRIIFGKTCSLEVKLKMIHFYHIFFLVSKTNSDRHKHIHFHTY